MQAKDFFNFKKMLTPVIIQILFWIGLVSTVITGLIQIIGGLVSRYGSGSLVLGGLFTIVLGPIMVRIYCELLIVIFSINDSLTDVRNMMKAKDAPSAIANAETTEAPSDSE